jgi:hypothetical protein
LILAGLAFWLAAGWFADDVPPEVQAWAVDTVIARAVVVLAIVCLAVALWVRHAHGSAHSRWASRSLVPAAIGFAVVLGWRWFGSAAAPDVDATIVERTTIILAMIATATGVLITAGAYLLRDRPPRRPPVEPVRTTYTKPAPARPLPVATLLDDLGRPILPTSANAGRGQSGPAGA